ncbi:C-Maf-inducing protein-like isoform X1 [Clavelina lepadiformis]|uniref:C-Maf-inducing protein-like isoform X1 n=2 Tax=Clavelina lepadiformis TaxID=159417 RepID=UPI0040419CC5
MSDKPVSGLKRNHNSSIKDKFLWNRNRRGAQSLKSRPSTKDADKQISKFNASSPDLFSLNAMSNKYNVFSGGYVKVHVLSEMSNMNIFEKLLHHTRSLKQWEIHDISLEQDEIVSKMPTGIFSTPLPYSSILGVMSVDLTREPINCVKIVTSSCTYLLQAPNAYQRDRWFYTIEWKMNVHKYRMKLYNSVKPEALLYELKVLVSLTVDCPLYIDDTHQVLLDIVSCLLSQKSEAMSNVSHEELITALAPLVDQNQPSLEICNFFSKHCRQSPRSIIVIDMFTPIVQRILKHNVDFGKSTWLRTFVVEYIQALNCQNNGIESVRTFIRSVHGPLSQCPHPRILNNLVAVCLSAIYQCFSTEGASGEKFIALKHKRTKTPVATAVSPVNEHTKNNLNNRVQAIATDVKNTKNSLQENLNKQLQQKEQQNSDAKPLNNSKQNRADLNLKESYTAKLNKLDEGNKHEMADENYQVVVLFVEVLKEISKILDWCPGLASLLQPLPFPDESMTNLQFTRLMYPVIERFAEDDRESVVKCLLYSREDKDGWLQVYSPGGSACEDNGKLFSKMTEALLKPGMQTGKLKKFLATLAKTHLQVVVMLALRENEVMIKVLRDMLQMGILTDEQEQLRVVSALRCTPSGKEMYEELKSLLMVLTQKKGPKAFTLAPNSTDSDLRTLFGTGSWGSLEHLDLSFTHVTSASVDVLRYLPNLRHLNLWATQIDDKGLRAICDYLDLESLNLCETRVTNEGILCLEVMTKLEYLNLNSTELNSETFLHLKKKLPNLLEVDINYTDALAEL